MEDRLKKLEAERAVALDPNHDALDDLLIGVIGAWDRTQDGLDAQFEVRAFAMGAGIKEDPVTGSLNAGLARWLIGSGGAQLGAFAHETRQHAL